MLFISIQLILANIYPMRQPVLFYLLFTVILASTNLSKAANHRTLIEDNPVFALLMDQHNIVWIGTENGLIKYDSKNITHYRFDPRDTLSLTDNSVRSLFLDSENNLWVGTRNGLNLYQPEFDNFRQFHLKKASDSFSSGVFIKSITEDSSGNIWIATENEGLKKLDPESGLFDHIIEGEGFTTITNNHIEKILVDHRGGLWVATRSGLNYREPGYNEWSRYYLSPDKKAGNIANDIISIELNHKGDLWIFTRDHKISRLKKNGQLVSFPFSDEITATFMKENGVLIWGTRYGELLSVDTNNETFFPQQLLAKQNISLGAIRTIMVDKYENYWIGDENGLTVFYHTKQQFKAVKETPDGKPLSNIMTMMQDSAEKIWISAERDLFVIDQNNWKQGRDLFTSGDQFEANYVYKLFQDRDNMIWIGTYDNGMYHYDPTTRHLKHYLWNEPEQSELTGSNSIWDILEDQDGNFYIGTWGGGLLFYNRAEESFTRHTANPTDKNSLSSNKILALLFDSTGTLWIATDGGGLNSFDPDTESFTRHNLHTDIRNTHSPMLIRSILCLYEDSKGTIWIGSDGAGLFAYDKATMNFTLYNHQQGLTNQSVKKIIEDDKGILWVSTNGGGIFMFETQKKVFVRFTHIDGLSTNRFHNGSGFKDHAGNIYFGGIEGFTWFNPENIKTSTHSPTIKLTQIAINNQIKNNHNHLFANIVNQTHSIRLKPNQQFLTLNFVAIEHSIANRNYYRYRLLGLNDEWTNLHLSPTISFMNLPAGRYELEIQASNSEGVWIGDSLIIKLVVLPPFYLTHWFIVLSTAFLLSVILFLYNYNVNKIKKRQAILEEKVEERTQKIMLQTEKLEKQNKILIAQQKELTSRNQKIIDSNERIRKMTKKVHESDTMKLNFFTKVSHEIRTPLTLIIGPLEHLIELHSKKNDTSLKLLNTIKKNAEKILKLFEQIVDFRKKEGGQLLLHKKTDNLSDFLLKLVEEQKDEAHNKNIQLSFHSESEGIIMDFDHEKIHTIFSCLVENAIKFTNHGGQVSIKIKSFLSENTGKDISTHETGHIKIWVTDTGIGIPSQDLDNIFDRFYQSGNKSIMETTTGVGIGLSITRELVELHGGKIHVESQQGKGSSFCVVLPFSYNPLPESLKENKKEKVVIINKIEPSAAPEPAPSEESNTKAPRQSDKPCKNHNTNTILVVEDNEELLNYLAGWLEKNFRIITAKNGLEGLQLAIEEKPDIIISDVIMPVMDGFELLSKLKADSEVSHIPVILLTAKVSIDDRITGLSLSADAYIDKPFHLKHLAATIDSLLENRRILQRKYQDIFNLEPTNIPVTSPDEIFLKKTRDIIEENISNPDFNAELLSREVGVSRSGLYRKLKSLTNLSVNIIIRNMRIKRAAQILSQNKLYVNEVAFMVGFNDVMYFRKCFRKMYDMTPSEYAAKTADKENPE